MISIAEALASQRALFIRQKKEWTEIIINFESLNRYAVMTEDGNTIGMIAERSDGFISVIKRLLFRSHRGFRLDVINQDGSPAMTFSRQFFFFFSDLCICDAQNQTVGSVHRRFGILYKKYDLKDRTGQTFATIASPLWRLWTFPITHSQGFTKGAEITKKWAGVLREVFTDADTFKVDFGAAPENFTKEQRTIIFGAAMSIDFDFFEENQGGNN